MRRERGRGDRRICGSNINTSTINTVELDQGGRSNKNAFDIWSRIIGMRMIEREKQNSDWKRMNGGKNIDKLTLIYTNEQIGRCR